MLVLLFHIKEVMQISVNVIKKVTAFMKIKHLPEMLGKFCAFFHSLSAETWSLPLWSCQCSSPWLTYFSKIPLLGSGKSPFPGMLVTHKSMPIHISAASERAHFCPYLLCERFVGSQHRVCFCFLINAITILPAQNNLQWI